MRGQLLLASILHARATLPISLDVWCGVVVFLGKHGRIDGQCLVASKFQKFYKIFHYIKSLDTCMEH
jgi:hypothetical protein